MAYGSETHAGFVHYDVVVDHAGTGVRASIRLDMTMTATGAPASEALADQVFQAFLTRVSGMPQATLSSAVKTGSFTAPVTP